MAEKGKIKRLVKKSAAPKKKTIATKRKRSILSETAVKKPTRRRSKIIPGKNISQEQIIEQSKYLPGPVIQKFEETKAFELPVMYG